MEERDRESGREREKDEERKRQWKRDRYVNPKRHEGSNFCLIVRDVLM